LTRTKSQLAREGAEEKTKVEEVSLSAVEHPPNETAPPAVETREAPAAEAESTPALGVSESTEVPGTPKTPLFNINLQAFKSNLKSVGANLGTKLTTLKRSASNMGIKEEEVKVESIASDAVEKEEGGKAVKDITADGSLHPEVVGIASETVVEANTAITIATETQVEVPPEEYTREISDTTSPLPAPVEDTVASTEESSSVPPDAAVTSETFEEEIAPAPISKDIEGEGQSAQQQEEQKNAEESQTRKSGAALLFKNFKLDKLEAIFSPKKNEIAAAGVDTTGTTDISAGVKVNVKDVVTETGEAPVVEAQESEVIAEAIDMVPPPAPPKDNEEAKHESRNVQIQSEPKVSETKEPKSGGGVLNKKRTILNFKISNPFKKTVDSGSGQASKTEEYGTQEIQKKEEVETKVIEEVINTSPEAVEQVKTDLAEQAVSTKSETPAPDIEAQVEAMPDSAESTSNVAAETTPSKQKRFSNFNFFKNITLKRGGSKSAILDASTTSVAITTAEASAESTEVDIAPQIPAKDIETQETQVEESQEVIDTAEVTLAAAEVEEVKLASTEIAAVADETIAESVVASTETETSAKEVVKEILGALVSESSETIAVAEPETIEEVKKVVVEASETTKVDV
jgi:hypothetical protein